MNDPLPAPTGTPYRIAMVCLGNICRSPMAEVVLRVRLAERGLTPQVEVTSGGTGTWHVGEPMNPPAAAALRHRGYDPDAQRASHVDASWLDRDLLLAMDGQNLRDLLLLGADPDRVRLFRSFDPLPDGPGGPGDVPDPWGGTTADFDHALDLVERTCTTLADSLAALLAST